MEVRVGRTAQELDIQGRRGLQDVDSNLSVLRIATFDQQLKRNFTRERRMAQLTEIFGLLALALACLGLYGVTSYLVAQRTGEIGIRTALGSGRSGGGAPASEPGLRSKN